MDERVKAALAAYADAARAALAESPLAGITAWISTGNAPSAGELRAEGLDGRSEPMSEAEGRLDWALRLARKAFIAEWGFSIPCAEAVEALRSLAPIAEVGAGTGYWTALLQAAGIEAVATDKCASGDLGYGFEAGRHSAVLAISAEETISRFPDYTAFCSWPTEGDDWALKAAALIGPGQHFALIGGSKTATPDLNRYLAEQFDLTGVVTLPQFPGCDDRLTIHRRR